MLMENTVKLTQDKFQPILKLFAKTKLTRKVKTTNIREILFIKSKNKKDNIKDQTKTQNIHKFTIMPIIKDKKDLHKSKKYQSSKCQKIIEEAKWWLKNLRLTIWKRKWKFKKMIRLR